MSEKTPQGAATPTSKDTSSAAENATVVHDRIDSLNSGLESLKHKTPMKPRLRFAPSPTGYLHIGGARTALWNWLFARRMGGTFVLRIEDTDQERSTPESLQAILDGLKWLGIDWDEGPGKDGPFPPYFQMKKLARYKEISELLIAQGKAYRDYTTEEETAQMRKDFAASKGLNPGDDLRKAGFKFSSPWRDKPTEQRDGKHVVRFRMQPKGEKVGFEDLIHGRLEKPDDDLDDFVLIRGDGIPLYNFGCVVDDHDMEISHVGRGQEHINSTYQQVVLYQALGWTQPVFAHFPLIMGANNEKLSKRKHPEADVMAHKRNGILPHALLNFVVRLGWSHGDDELFTREQLIALFDLKDVGKTNGVWNPEKLISVNQHWIKTFPPEEVAKALLPYLQEAGVQAAVDARLITAVRAFAPRAKTLVEMTASIKPYYARGVTMDAAAATKHLDDAGKKMLQNAKLKLLALAEWSTAAIDPIVDAIAAETGAKKGAIAQPLRVAVTGGTTSPGIGDTLALLGRDETMHRIDAVLGS